MDKIYRGWTIKLNDRMHFEISGVPEGLEDREGMLRSTYETYFQVTTAIDHAMELEKKRAAGHFTLKLPGVSLDGLPFVCKGINRTQRTLLGRPERPSSGIYKTPLSSDNMWPDVPWIRERLALRRQLFDEIDRIDDQLRPFAIAPTKSGYGRVPTENYEGYIEDLKKRHAEMTAKAEAHADVKAAARELLDAG